MSEEKGIYIVNDPFRTLIEAALMLYPDLKVDIYFMAQAQIDEVEKDALGITNFPDDGGMPDICIKAEQTVIDALDIMAHELAHVAAGIEAGHGPEWKAAYDGLYRKYHEIVDMKSEEEADGKSKRKI